MRRVIVAANRELGAVLSNRDFVALSAFAGASVLYVIILAMHLADMMQ